MGSFAFQRNEISVPVSIRKRSSFFFFLIFFSPITSLFFFLILFYLTLQYCIGFAIYQNESATGIHVFPILNPPPSSVPVPSLWVVPVHQPQASSIMHLISDRKSIDLILVLLSVFLALSLHAPLPLSYTSWMTL